MTTFHIIRIEMGKRRPRPEAPALCGARKRTSVFAVLGDSVAKIKAGVLQRHGTLLSMCSKCERLQAPAEKPRAAVRLEMPAEGAERLRKLWEERDPTFLAAMQAIGFEILDVIIPGMPWCEACKSYHAEPRSPEHKAELQCRS